VTFSIGDAGAITVKAGNLLIDGELSNNFTGINSSASLRSEGNAGSITVNSKKLLSIVDKGGISSSTFSIGNAGTVTVEAGDLLIDGEGSKKKNRVRSFIYYFNQPYPS